MDSKRFKYWNDYSLIEVVLINIIIADFLFIILGILDVITTKIGLKYGAIEINPFGKNHFKKSLIIKICLAVVLVYFSFFDIFAYYLIMIGVFVMSIVVINNFIQIRRVRKERHNEL